MDTPPRFLSELETRELIKRLCAYIKLEGQCIRALEARGANVKSLYDNTRKAFLIGTDPGAKEDESPAMEWIRFILNESFSPVFKDAEEELERIQRYLVTASLVASESGILLEDDEA